MLIISNIIKSFLLTLIIEYLIVKLFVKKKVFVPVLLVNILTNPLIVYIYNIMNLLSFEYKDVILIFLELLVVIVEGYVYKYFLEINWKKALIISCISNTVAFFIGIILNLLYL